MDILALKWTYLPLNRPTISFKMDLLALKWTY